jgi:7 transmembrane sweet-taste receptor of 3 GCPR
MSFIRIVSVVAGIVLSLSGQLINACQSPSPNVFPKCGADILVEYSINPELAYFRPTEVGLSDPLQSVSPEYFALSGGAIAMTQTLNQLYFNHQTVHNGPVSSIFNVSIPVFLNQSDSSLCQQLVNVSVIPQYNLTISDIGTEVELGLQGQTNNRDSCQTCSQSQSYALIHGTLSSTSLYEVAAQVCNAFNVPTIAASVTDETFDELYPQAAASGEWSARSSTGPTQVGNALGYLLYQYDWTSVIMFVDPVSQTQANYVSEIAQAMQNEIVDFLNAYTLVPFLYIDSSDTGCASALPGVTSSGVSLLYLDIAVSRSYQCITQLVQSGLLSQNYVFIWGPTLMSSINNDLQLLAATVNVPVANLTGTFTIQIRSQQASFVPLLQSNIASTYASWNAPWLSQYQEAYASSVFDNANAVILASQGVHGFIANELCLLTSRGVYANVSTTEEVVNVVTEALISLISGSNTPGPYEVTSNANTWEIFIPTTTLNFLPSRAFYFYTEESGMYSTSTNIQQWYHDNSGNSLITIDIYNVQQNGAENNSSLVGSYYSATSSWQLNPSLQVVWPNPLALWQYVSGWPSSMPPLSALSLQCVTNYSCTSPITFEGFKSVGYAQVATYSSEVTLSGDGSWNTQLACVAPGGQELSYDAYIVETSQSDMASPWNLFINPFNGQLQVSFSTADIDAANWPGGSILVEFLCSNGPSRLNGTLEITVIDDSSGYTASNSAQWGLAIANGIGAVFSVWGFLLTLVHRKKRSFYASSIPFLLTIWLGFGVLFGAGIISIVPVTNSATCQAQSWMFNYGFALIMGSLLIKTWHIHLIYNSRTLLVKSFSTLELMIGLAGVLSAFTVVMLSWQLIPTAQLHRRSEFQPYCVTGSRVPFHILAGMELLLVIVSAYLSYRTRMVSQDHNESKCIIAVSYNTVLWGTCWWVLSSQFSIEPSVLEFLTSLFLCVACFMNMFLFFTPKFLGIWGENNRSNFERTSSKKNSDIRPSALRYGEHIAASLMGNKLSNSQFEVTNNLEGLRQARDKLFESLRKLKSGDAERNRLRVAMEKSANDRYDAIGMVNGWLATVRALLDQRKTMPGDTSVNSLLDNLKEITAMNTQQMMDEAQKQEEQSTRRPPPKESSAAYNQTATSDLRQVTNTPKMGGSRLGDMYPHIELV